MSCHDQIPRDHQRESPQKLSSKDVGLFDICSPPEKSMLQTNRRQRVDSCAKKTKFRRDLYVEEREENVSKRLKSHHSEEGEGESFSSRPPITTNKNFIQRKECDSMALPSSCDKVMCDNNHLICPESPPPASLRTRARKLSFREYEPRTPSGNLKKDLEFGDAKVCVDDRYSTPVLGSKAIPAVYSSPLKHSMIKKKPLPPPISRRVMDPESKNIRLPYFTGMADFEQAAAEDGSKEDADSVFMWPNIENLEGMSMIGGWRNFPEGEASQLTTMCST